MRKLIIAFAGIVAAVAVNAASMNWSLSYSYESGADTDSGPFANGWLVAIFDSGNAATSTSDAITALLAGDAASAVSTYAVSTATTDADGAASRYGVTFSGNAGDTLTAFLVLFDASTAASASNFIVSDAVSAVAPLSGAAGTFDFDDFTKSASGTWTATGAAPEPTSGLLMLLGMAGFALRRRRA